MNLSSKICRACMAEKGSMQSIFTEIKFAEHTEELAEVLKSCTSLEISLDDDLPNELCTRCIRQATKAYLFRQQCITSESILRQNFQNQDQTSLGVCSEDIINSPNFQNITIKEEFSECGESAEKRDIENEIEQDDPISIDRKTRIKLNTVTQNNHVELLPPYICNVCHRELKSYGSLKVHMQLHSEKTPFLCSACGASFKTKMSYRGHMVTHNENNPHKCDTCGKSYRQAASLRNHVMTHTGERPYLCMVCGHGCIQKSDFKKHLMTHSEEKPFVCNICGNKFRFSHNLKQHIRSHTGERPYSCTVCEKKFSAKTRLNRHMLIHTGEKPFSCNLCGKCFNRAGILAVHRKRHTKQRDHVCKVCGRDYVEARCLQLHMNKHKHIPEDTST